MVLEIGFRRYAEGRRAVPKCGAAARAVGDISISVLLRLRPLDQYIAVRIGAGIVCGAGAVNGSNKRRKSFMNILIEQGIRLGVCVVLLGSAACSRNEVGKNISENGDSTVEAGQPSMIEPLTLEQQINGAIEDLAGRAAVDLSVVKISRARSVVWASGALGCPEAGKSYTQAVVPGVQLLLEADGKTYRYHGAKGSAMFHCPEERARAPAYGPGEEIM
jgi:hypothetical protein